MASRPTPGALRSGALPIGLSLASNGVISGTPVATGVSTFTVQVVDSSKPTPQSATAILTITVNAGITDNLQTAWLLCFLGPRL